MFNFIVGQFCSCCGIGCCTETSCWRKANTSHVCKEISLLENNEPPTTTRSGYLFCHLRPFLFYKIKFNWFHFWVAHSSFLNQVVLKPWLYPLKTGPFEIRFSKSPEGEFLVKKFGVGRELGVPNSLTTHNFFDFTRELCFKVCG